MTGRSVLLALIAITFAAQFGSARAQENGGVVADISQHLVAISSGFRGTNLLLFGATDPDTDVVVVVEGPTGPASVRRKGRVAGVWMNTDEVLFEDIPSFYAVLSNRPLSEFTTPALRLVQEIGFDSLPLYPKQEAVRKRADLQTFRDALIRAKMRRGLYQSEENSVEIIRERLFRTDVHVPANAPVGSYWVRVFQLRDDSIVSAQTSVLDVDKVGFTAHVFDLAHRHSFAYGVLAILIAVMAGWLAGVIFRKH